MFIEKIAGAAALAWSALHTNSEYGRGYGYDSEYRGDVGMEGTVCKGCVTREEIVAPGIGIDLTPTYGTVAIRYHNQSVINVGQIDGSPVYKDLMKRLAPPYRYHGPPFNNIKDQLDYEYEQLQRQIRKARGLPANPDTEILSEMVYNLHLLASLHSDVPVTNSVYLSRPELPNITWEDFNELFVFANLTESRSYRGGYIRDIQIATAFVGSGYGLCKTWAVFQTCQQEEATMPDRSVLFFDYTEDDFIISHSWARNAYQMYTDVHESFPDFSYGQKPSSSQPKYETQFWEGLKLRVTTVVKASSAKPDTLVLIGDRAGEKKFVDTVGEALGELQMDGLAGGIVVDGWNPVFLGARGGAELAKRAQGEPKGCVEGDWCENRKDGEDGMPKAGKADGDVL